MSRSKTSFLVLLLGVCACNSAPSAPGPTAGQQATQAATPDAPSPTDTDTDTDRAGSAGARASTRGSAGTRSAGGSPSTGTAGQASGTGGRGAGEQGAGSAGQAAATAGQSAGGHGSAGQNAAGTTAQGTATACPPGPFGTPIPAAGAKAERVAGLPPADAFNDMGNTRTNVEGPVWIGDKLYVSEFAFMPAPDARILALDPASGEVSVALTGTGSNGLAVDMSGALIATDHKQGAIVRMPFPLGMGAQTLTGMFEGKRFNSPNDLAVRSDGTVYFSDPDYQAPSMRPQDKTRVYHLAAGTDTPDMFDDTRSQPNGVTLSADEKTLYVAGADGVFSYPVAADGKVAPGSGTRLDAFNGGADGLGMDCAGNLYITSGQRIVVLSAAGMEIGSVDVSQAESVTNVAFGGPEHKTLFITSMGAGDKRGVFRVELEVPGFPY